MEERLASYRLRFTTFFSLFCLTNVIFFNPSLAKCLQAVDFTVSISTSHKKEGPPAQDEPPWDSVKLFARALGPGPYAIPSQVLMTGIQPPTHTMTMSAGST